METKARRHYYWLFRVENLQHGIEKKLTIIDFVMKPLDHCAIYIEYRVSMRKSKWCNPEYDT